MKHDPWKPLVFGVILLLMSPLPGSAQSPVDSLPTALNQSFADLKKDRGIIFDPALEEGWKHDYRKALETVEKTRNSGKCRFPEKISAFMDRYTQVAGIAERLNALVKNIDAGNTTEPVAAWLSTRAKEECTGKSQYSLISKDDKYGTLFVETIPGDVDAEIYLNGLWLCTSKEASNGIRLTSDKRYVVEIKCPSVGSEPLKEDISLEGRERRTLKYVTKK